MENISRSTQGDTPASPAAVAADVLAALLASINAARARGRRDSAARDAQARIERLYQPSRRLAVYGTLAPGRRNHPVLAACAGEWTRAVVRGRVYERGWGAAGDCPGLVQDPRGAPVEVHLLVSADLPRAWRGLDAFEGGEYRRVLGACTA